MALAQRAFAEWAPDLPALNHPGETVARNCLPASRGYRPLRTLTALSPAMGALCRGAISATEADGTVHIYAGDASKLYEVNATSATDRSKSGGYSLTDEEYWEAAQFGNQVIFCSLNEDTQAITIGGTAFADLSGTPPRAAHIAVVRGFVVMGNTWDTTDGYVPNRVRWSALEDATGWTVGTSQSDFQNILGNGGAVRKVVGGEYGVIFQERAIHRMTYEGPPTVFRFDEVETGRGTQAPGSVVQLGGLVFYLGLNGFYVFDGSRSTPIGDGKVDQTFFSMVDTNYLHRISAAADPENKLVVWAYPTQSGGVADGIPSRLLIFDYSKGRWSEAEVNVERLFHALSVGTDLDSLDNVSSSLDSLRFSLDSRVWIGGDLLMGAFDTDHKLGYFTGDPMVARIETGEMALNPGGTAHLSAVRPQCDGTPTVYVGTRDTAQDANSYGDAATPNDLGECDFREDGRFHRIRLDLEDWTEAHGLDLEFRPSGRR